MITVVEIVVLENKTGNGKYFGTGDAGATINARAQTHTRNTEPRDRTATN